MTRKFHTVKVSIHAASRAQVREAADSAGANVDERLLPEGWVEIVSHDQRLVEKARDELERILCRDYRAADE